MIPRSLSVSSAFDRRVLVVEDEWLIASEVERELNEAGYRTVGPVTSVESALDAIEREDFDGAVLDVRLNSLDAYPVADRLAARQIPFVFMTGYAADDLAGRFRGHACLTKPFSSEGLVAAVAGMLSPSGEGAVRSEAQPI